MLLLFSEGIIGLSKNRLLAAAECFSYAAWIRAWMSRSGDSIQSMRRRNLFASKITSSSKRFSLLHCEKRHYAYLFLTSLYPAFSFSPLLVLGWARSVFWSSPSLSVVLSQYASVFLSLPPIDINSGQDTERCCESKVLVGILGGD